MPGEVDVKLVQFEDAYGKETYVNADRVKQSKVPRSRHNCHSLWYG